MICILLFVIIALATWYVDEKYESAEEEYNRAAKGNLPYEDIALTEPDALVNLSMEISGLYYEISDTYYLKIPEGNTALTKKQLEKTIHNLRSRSDLICTQFE